MLSGPFNPPSVPVPVACSKTASGSRVGPGAGVGFISSAVCLLPSLACGISPRDGTSSQTHNNVNHMHAPKPMQRLKFVLQQRRRERSSPTSPSSMSVSSRLLSEYLRFSIHPFATPKILLFDKRLRMLDPPELPSSTILASLNRDLEFESPSASIGILNCRGEPTAFMMDLELRRGEADVPSPNSPCISDAARPGAVLELPGPLTPQAFRFPRLHAHGAARGCIA